MAIYNDPRYDPALAWRDTWHRTERKTWKVATGPAPQELVHFDPANVDWEGLMEMYADDPLLVELFEQLSRYRSMVYRYDPPFVTMPNTTAPTFTIGDPTFTIGTSTSEPIVFKSHYNATPNGDGSVTISWEEK